MVDMPVTLSAESAEPAESAESRIGFGSISERVADLTPIIQMVRHTWSTQTLDGLKEGKVTVPDDVINESLAKYSDEHSSIYDIQVTSLEENKLRLQAKTQQFGALDFVCRIDQLQHNKDISLLKFTVLEKDLPDQAVLSWIFSRVSLSMVEKMVGRIDLGETIKSKVVGDTVAIDFHTALENTAFGQANLFGYRLSSAVEIESAVPQAGYIEFKTSLHVPDAMKSMLSNILK